MFAAEHGCDLCGRAGVVDFELLGGFFAAGAFREFDAAAFDGEMEVVAACPGIAAGFGAGSRGHVGDAERREGIAQRTGFAGREDDADLWKTAAEGAGELDECAIGEEEIRIGLVLIVSGVGSHPWECDGELGFPAVFVEMFEVGGEGEGFVSPVGEAEEGTDADPTESSGIGPFGAVEAPIEVFLRAGGVEALVGFPVVGFLVNDQSFGAVADDLGILVVFHRADLDGEGGDEAFQGVEAVLEIAIGNEFRVFASDEQQIAKAEFVQVAGFADDLVDAQGDAENRVIAGESAIGTVVDAFVGQIERCEESHRAAEVAASQLLALAGEGFELAIRGGRDEAFEAAEQG